MDLNINFVTRPDDKNIYKVIRLDNQLDCLLISDSEADKSAASMAVDVGDCDDPVQRPGLAHFLEHMLFMGTKKYPDQNAYGTYLSENNGFNNAYTENKHTNYQLDCSNEAFEGALDRFAQFFIEPLFHRHCVNKELKAVNSENEMCITDDSWREGLLFRMSGKEGNPYTKFPVGNLKSLRHPNIREEVKKFYEEKYSSNYMKLCIYSNHSISLLEEWVKKYFSEIPNKNYPIRIFTEMPYDKTNLNNIYKVVPIKDGDHIEFIWVLEGMHKYYKNNPLRYIAHLIGHEGENSLLSFFKEEGLATELETETNEELNLFSTLVTRIRLTPLGFENYKSVIGYMFQYLNMLKKYGAQRWIFDEIHQTCNMKFEFLEKCEPVDFVTDLADRLLTYPYEDVLKLEYFMENFEEELFNSITSKLTLENLRVVLISKKLEPECNLVEEWYSVKHTFHGFDECIENYYSGKDVPKPRKTKKKLDLPVRNIFLPKNFDVLYKLEDKLPDDPIKIKDDEVSEVWFKRDNKYFVPKAVIHLNIYLKDGSFGHSVKTYMLNQLWLKLFKHHTQEMVYLAHEANIEVEFNLTNLGFYLLVKGSGDTTLTVVIKYFEKILTFFPNELKDIFDDLLYEEVQEAKNFVKENSYNIAGNLIDTYMQTGNNFHIEKRIKTLENITFKDLLAFHDIILRNFKLLWFFSGNLKEEEVISTVSSIEAILTTKREGVKFVPLKEEETTEIRVVQLPDDSNWIYEYSLKRESDSETVNKNSAVFLIFQLKRHTDTHKILNDVLNNLLTEPFFEQLRTNEQLGYVVYCQPLILRGINHFAFVIQSDVKCPFFIRERIEAFLETFAEKIVELSDKQYKKYVESVRHLYLQKPLNLEEESDRQWNEIISRQFYFNKREKYAEILLNITKKEFQEFIQEALLVTPRKFEVHVIAEKTKKKNEKLKEDLVEDINYVGSEDEFKRSLGLFPDFFSTARVNESGGL